MPPIFIPEIAFASSTTESIRPALLSIIVRLSDTVPKSILIATSEEESLVPIPKASIGPRPG